MTGFVIVGTQWGDEGKGKIVDLLSAEADAVVRFQGGNNAGHTMVVKGEKVISHLVPSGILRKKICMIGNGLVVDPEVLLGEMDYLREKGVDVRPHLLRISEKAHVIMPYHRRIDRAREALKGADKIGTTGKGIGPCYEDKATRRGIRFTDLMDPEIFEKRLALLLEEKNFYLKNFLKDAPISKKEITDAYLGYAERLRPHVGDVAAELDAALLLGEKVLFEGAQGAHLDIDHGTYPFVTSSNTVSANACTGAGVGPTMINGVMGIAKAYTTRVGAGPFPTELFDAVGDRIQKTGAEFGATTGRRRRCGWLDMVVLNNARRLNGLTGLAVTKLDVLGGLETLHICTGYAYKDRILTDFPASTTILDACRPVYETLDGWSEDISGVRHEDDLPENTRKYLKRIEEISKTPVHIISVGPDREQTIVKTHPFLS